jgi:hypothetical protein
VQTSTHAFEIVTALRGLDSHRRENGECSEEAEGRLHRHGHRAAAKTQPLGITIVVVDSTVRNYVLHDRGAEWQGGEGLH